MDKERFIGTYVDLHGYFHPWFPIDRAEVVTAALQRTKEPFVVFQDDQDGLTNIEILNIHAARRWSIQELDYWPEPQRGKMLVMTVEQDEDGLPCVRLSPPDSLKHFEQVCRYYFRLNTEEQDA